MAAAESTQSPGAASPTNTAPALALPARDGGTGAAAAVDAGAGAAALDASGPCRTAADVTMGDDADGAADIANHVHIESHCIAFEFERMCTNSHRFMIKKNQSF